MTSIADGSSSKPLRLRPGVVLLALQWLAFFLPFVIPSVGFFGMLGALVAGLAIVVWWLFFSRAPWLERVLAIALMPLAAIAARRFVHPTIQQRRNGPNDVHPRRPLPVPRARRLGGPEPKALEGRKARLAAHGTRARSHACSRSCAPAGSAARAARTFTGAGRRRRRSGCWPEAASPSRSPPAPKASAEPPAAPASEPATTPSAAPASKSQAKAALQPQPAGSRPSVPADASSRAPAAADADWPGFRGPARDGVIRGVSIATDWSKSPPVELWRRAIGPGWSSFAVKDGLVYTQEQRGEEEQVSCYRLDSGQPVWRHGDPIRHWDSEGGPGPRATPTVRDGRVYSFGGTGRLNALDAASGAVVWSRDVAADTGVETPGWGFASSPLVVGDVVIVAASGRLAAYELTSGERRWLGPEGGGGYSSPQLATIAGVQQVLLLRGARSTSVAPADGALLWEHRAQPSVSIVQPALTAEGDVLVASGDAMGGNGIRRLAVAHGPGGWSVEERWLSTGLKPYFNDFVVHKGHAFGFDGGILACIDLADGQRKWKGGRYGHGQLVLLAEQDLLLVVAEEGELALVKATPEAFTEVAKAPALHGKTWSHPALVGDVLLVRNGEEMAAFRLRQREVAAASASRLSAAP